MRGSSSKGRRVLPCLIRSSTSYPTLLLAFFHVGGLPFISTGEWPISGLWAITFELSGTQSRVGKVVNIWGIWLAGFGKASYICFAYSLVKLYVAHGCRAQRCLPIASPPQNN